MKFLVEGLRESVRLIILTWDNLFYIKSSLRIFLCGYPHHCYLILNNCHSV